MLSGASYYACEFMQPNKIIETYFGSKFKAETPGDSASFDQRSRRSASAAAMMMTEVKTKMIYPSLFLLPSLPCRRRWPVCLPRRSKRREGRKAFGRRRALKEEDDDEESMVTGSSNGTGHNFQSILPKRICYGYGQSSLRQILLLEIGPWQL